MNLAKTCARCVLDAETPGIDFDERGLCSYCRHHDEIALQPNFSDESLRKQAFKRIIEEIKGAGLKKKYDCLIGLSGGADSTYLAWAAKQNGLRPLAVHFDNGWNSELAVSNISNIVTVLKLDLQTHVAPWEIFKDLQLAYMKASVVDIEVPTDHFILATLYKTAAKEKIKYILSGENYATESIMPKGWNYSSKLDLKNLENIHKRYGKLKLRRLPKLGCYQRAYYEGVLKIRRIRLLNNMPYVKAAAKETIEKDLGWRDYGHKHYESIFTRFYQGYILPRKFKIDKRKAHFSNLICSGQMTREEALRELAKPPYPLEQQMAEKEYVIKKLGLSEQEFEAIMNLPVQKHSRFGAESNYPQRLAAKWKALTRNISKDKIIQ